MSADRPPSRLADWLGSTALDDATLLACRFHQRTGPWSTVHRPDEHLLVLVERGALMLRVGRTRWRAEGGDLLWLPPGPARTLGAIAQPLAVRHGNLRLGSAGPCPLRRLRRVRDAWDLLPLWEQLAEAAAERGRLQALRRRCLLRCLLATALVLPSARGERGLGRRQRRELLRLVEEAPPGALEPADLAAALDLSPDYFARRFRASYGTTPRRWLFEQRLRRAAEAVAEGDEAIAAIAARSGFSTTTWFCRAFREVLGCTPLAWRRRGMGSSRAGPWTDSAGVEELPASEVERKYLS